MHDVHVVLVAHQANSIILPVISLMELRGKPSLDSYTYSSHVSVIG